MIFFDYEILASTKFLKFKGYDLRSITSDLSIFLSLQLFSTHFLYLHLSQFDLYSKTYLFFSTLALLFVLNLTFKNILHKYFITFLIST